MTIKEKILDQVQEMPLEVNPTMKDIDNYNLSINNLEKIADEFAIGFTLFLSDNVYENMYQDIDGDGKTWVSYLHDGYDNHPTARRFTIQELLEIFKKEKGL